MALTALISACRTVAESEQLRATLPLAGHTLIEHQARLAVRGGAERVVVLVERLPVALVAAIDRLRRGGLNVEIARRLIDVTGRVSADDALLLIADGFVGSGRLVARIAEARDQAMLTVPDDAAHARFERIDAHVRWGGLLLIDGQRLHRVAAILGEWDLESTLLRSAVQAGVTRIAADEGGLEGAARIVEGAGELAALEADLFAAARRERSGGDWPQRYVYPAIERIGVLPLLAHGAEPAWLAMAAAVAAWAAAVLALVGWCGTGLALLLLSGPTAAIGRTIAAARLIEPRNAGTFVVARTAGGVAALLAVVSHLETQAGWGVWPLAAVLLVAMVALAIERRSLARLPGGAGQPWLASLDGLVLLLLPFVLAGYWPAGLAALAGYATVSLFAAQREVLARLAASPSEEE
jgi:hypothetical protein